LPNIKSAKKRVLVSGRKHDRNQVVRSAVKTRITRVRRLLEAGESQPTAEITAAASALDKAAERGVLHPNNAARRKSRLMRAAHRAATLAADPEAAAKAAAEARSHGKGSGKSAQKAGAGAKSGATARSGATKGTAKKSTAKPAAPKGAAKGSAKK
jgi:small subunit ribosomal protein S20